MTKRRKYSGHAHEEKPCHAGPVQVIKNLYCGSRAEFMKKAEAQAWVDTMVPLNDLDGEIWATGFCGEILYYPIEDFGVLPDNVMEELAAKAIERLRRNMSVGLFCQGGHGRTGYVASIILGKLGYEDPIGYLREHYCKNAVESNSQVCHIANILEKPELVEKYETKYAFNFWDDYTFEGIAMRGLSGSFGHETERASPTCGMCGFFSRDKCDLHGCEVDKYTMACCDFISNWG